MNNKTNCCNRCLSSTVTSKSCLRKTDTEVLGAVQNAMVGRLKLC